MVRMVTVPHGAVWMIVSRSPFGKLAMRPVTIGTLAASTLAIAHEALLKGLEGSVGEQVNDAYRALKEKVSPWCRKDVEALEEAPTSVERQAIIAEEIDRQSPKDQADVKKLA